MRILNKYWRILGTGFCFSVFGIGGLILTFTVFPVMSFFSKDPLSRELKVQRLIQKCFILFRETMRMVGTLDYKIEGMEKLQQDHGCLIISNHPSLIDYVLITSCLPQCDCIVKASIWKNTYMKGTVKAAGYIPNIESDRLVQDCSKRFAQGNRLLVFPEGTRTRTTGERPKMQRGAAQIAIRSRVDLRLVHITVTPRFLTKEAKWYQVPDTKPVFHVEVKDLIKVDDFISDTESPTISARKLNRYIEQVLFPENG